MACRLDEGQRGLRSRSGPPIGGGAELQRIGRRVGSLWADGAGVVEAARPRALDLNNDQSARRSTTAAGDQHEHRVILGDQLLGVGGCCGGRLAELSINDHLDMLAVDAALGVDGVVEQAFIASKDGREVGGGLAAYSMLRSALIT